jgi:hypothetical protein
VHLPFEAQHVQLQWFPVELLSSLITLNYFSPWDKVNIKNYSLAGPSSQQGAIKIPSGLEGCGLRLVWLVIRQVSVYLLMATSALLTTSFLV